MSKPWIPRMHLFEIDDQPWFPPFLRAHVQAGLTHAWNFQLPPLQACTPAALVAETLRRTLGGDRGVAQYTYIDFCAGAGGPTPDIERALNERLLQQTDGNGSTGISSSSATPVSGTFPPSSPTAVNGNAGSSLSYAAAASTENGKGRGEETKEKKVPARFVMTDLHPHATEWAAACKRSEHLSYIAEPVDASAAPAELIARYTEPGKKVFRLYNLAFHHFDDGLARAMLRNTIETSDGFGIFELQERGINSFITCFIFGLFSIFIAPFYFYTYYFLTAPISLIFIWLLPIIPFVLVFDGLVSSLRTRTPAEVEALLQTCGADATGWELRSGRNRFLWPTGYMSWVICTKK